MTKILKGLIFAFTALFAGSYDNEINCASFDSKVALMGVDFLPSEIVKLYNNGLVSVKNPKEMTFIILQDGFVVQYETKEAEHTYTNLRKEKGSGSKIECSAIKMSMYKTNSYKPIYKKIYYTIFFDENAKNRLVVKIKK